MNNISEQWSYGASAQRKGNEETSQITNTTTVSLDEKKATVHAELERVNKLPGNSSYAVHRMRVLNKLLHLLSIQRTALQDKELEQLFARLSL